MREPSSVRAFPVQIGLKVRYSWVCRSTPDIKSGRLVQYLPTVVTPLTYIFSSNKDKSSQSSTEGKDHTYDGRNGIEFQLATTESSVSE